MSSLFLRQTGIRNKSHLVRQKSLTFSVTRQVGETATYTLTATATSAQVPPKVINTVTVSASGTTVCASGGLAPCVASFSLNGPDVLPNIPTLSAWVAVALAGFLLALGGMSIRRRVE